MARPNRVLEVEPTWRQDALCHGMGSDLFYPVGTTGAAVEQIAAAKSICQNCIAKLACLDFAMQNDEQYGIWGETTQQERHQLRKHRREANSA